MRKFQIMLGLLLLAGIYACAGTLIEGSVTVAAGETNAYGDITLNLSASREAPEIDRLSVANASGGGTGTVSFVALDAGVSVSVASTNSVAPGASAVIWPKRQYTVGSTTNAERYAARTLRVNVAQSVTNSADTVYNIGALVR
jgi:hypothetical protein